MIYKINHSRWRILVLGHAYISHIMKMFNFSKSNLLYWWIYIRQIKYVLRMSKKGSPNSLKFITLRVGLVLLGYGHIGYDFSSFYMGFFFVFFVYLFFFYMKEHCLNNKLFNETLKMHCSWTEALSFLFWFTICKELCKLGV